MARGRHKNFDRVSDYVGEQISQLSNKYHRFRFVFFAIFAMIAVANITVAGLALTVMVRVVQNNRFDDVGIVALSAAAASLLNLILVVVNATFRYNYKKEIYQEASKTIENAYVAYAYKIGKYENDGLEKFKQDVQNIVDHVSVQKAPWWRVVVRRTKDWES